MSEKDQVFAESFSQISAFEFNEKVVSVFPDMIKRSVPGYDTILKGIAMLAMKYIEPKTHVYDLGASLGAVSLTVDQAIGIKMANIYAIDNAEAMIDQLNNNLQSISLNNKIVPELADVFHYPMSNASMVVSNFTLQFMPAEQRDTVIKDIFNALNPEGVFVLSEKVKSSQELIDYYHGYKKVNGYSDMEIAQKRQALEDSLKPDTLDEWVERLKAAGFNNIEVWFRAFNFISITAVK